MNHGDGIAPQVVTIPAGTTPPIEAPATTGDGAQLARTAVRTGIWLSALRCLLTYVLVPSAGIAGAALGPVGLVLQILAAITSTTGARRLWSLRHPLRVPYTLVAAGIDLVAAATLISLLST